MQNKPQHSDLDPQLTIDSEARRVLKSQFNINVDGLPAVGLQGIRHNIAAISKLTDDAERLVVDHLLRLAQIEGQKIDRKSMEVI